MLNQEQSYYYTGRAKIIKRCLDLYNLKMIAACLLKSSGIFEEHIKFHLNIVSQN